LASINGRTESFWVANVYLGQKSIIIAQMELEELEIKILDALTFPESYESLLNEIKEDEAVVADVLKILIAKELVTPMSYDKKTQRYIQGYMYDSDDMTEYYYCMSSKGMKVYFSD
jgi:predicted transcriptional regulator